MNQAARRFSTPSAASTPARTIENAALMIVRAVSATLSTTVWITLRNVVARLTAVWRKARARAAIRAAAPATAERTPLIIMPSGGRAQLGREFSRPDAVLAIAEVTAVIAVSAVFTNPEIVASASPIRRVTF